MSDGHWQLEGNAAELYQRYLVPGITSKWAEDLVNRTQLRTEEEVLDVACGTGVVARLAAKKVASGHVTGLDLNAGMLVVARGVLSEGAPVNWIEGSALDLPFPSGRFDAVLCQLGLQFFPDQPKALREMRRVVREPGRVALSVYSPLERTPGADAFVRALDKVLGSQASRIKRGEHSFANPPQLEKLLRDASFGTVVVIMAGKALAGGARWPHANESAIASLQTFAPACNDCRLIIASSVKILTIFDGQF
jgi:ubiquinone/menaquinone biosynthesis C-methylase UbiE